MNICLAGAGPAVFLWRKNTRDAEGAMMKKMRVAISFAALGGAILLAEQPSASAVEMPGSCNIGFQHLKECCTISFRRRPMGSVESGERRSEIMACISRMKADAEKRQQRGR